MAELTEFLRRLFPWVDTSSREDVYIFWPCMFIGWFAIVGFGLSRWFSLFFVFGLLVVNRHALARGATRLCNLVRRNTASPGTATQSRRQAEGGCSPRRSPADESVGSRWSDQSCMTSLRLSSRSVP